MSTDSSLPPPPASPRPQQPLFATQSSYFLPPTPPPATPPPPPSRTSPKRPSLSASAAMNWLSHKSSNSIASFTSLRTRSNSLNKDQAPSLQTLRISGPITLEQDPAMHPRPRHHQLQAAAVRPLGTGAEVVGTPAEALERPPRVTSPPNNNNNNAPRRPGDLPPIPQSPPGPTTPIRGGGGPVGLRSSKSSPHLKSPTFHYHHSRTPSEYSNALRSPPPPPARSSFRSGGGAAVVPPLTPFPTPPAQALNIPSSETGSISVPPVAPQPKFTAVLLSSNLDPKFSSRKSQVIVTLETSTEVFKTTLSTLTSRPCSYAAAWFESVVKSGGEEPIEEEREEEVGGGEEVEPASTTSSVPPSPFTRVFQDHLTSQGLRASVPSYREIHLFMDRSSAPYPHILNYLRSPVESTALPRAVQLGEAPSPTSTHDATKVDALLELRDEAAYLGLEGLVLLCEVELRKWYVASRRHSSQQHKPTQSTSTAGTTAVASRPTSTSSPRTSAVVTTTTTVVPPTPPPRSLRRAASHRILSPGAVPESINEDDVVMQQQQQHSSDGGDAPWSEFGVAMRPSSVSEDGSSGVYDSSAPEDSSSSSAPSTAVATLTIHTGGGSGGDVLLRTNSPETITRATAGHLRSLSSSAIPLGMSPFPPNPNRPLPDVPSSTTSSAVSTPTTAPAPLAPSVGLGLRTRNKTRSRSNSRSEGVNGVVRPAMIIPPATIAGAGRGGAERHQRGNSFLPSLMSPTTPKTAGSSSNWI
ncbi:hypothetical protein M407DRAFT_96136 [Tulasnella calospora MUT 4182]|uniref:BTB domain-containing protein n=1 Tax=Tulasnella calospora MUT 4182 TaxID=1051891 RepID=A0A0C3QU35_9AGAM|nr:hypothetical protein M407DRAFT_96136 [Tulasnella calospora MUT 4182]